MAIDGPVFRYLVSGLGNTLVGLSIIYLAKAIGVGDVAANATGYSIGIALSFLLNRTWTFRHQGPILGAALRFVTVLAAAYAANLVIVLTAISWLGINSYLSQALGVPVYTTLSYLGSRWYAFRVPQSRLGPSA